MSLRECNYASAEAMTAALATDLAAALRAALQLRGRASLAVSGGKSPLPLFETLAREPLDWSRVAITLVDERWVDPQSEDSNERLVRRHLLQQAAAGARFVPLKTAAAQPEDAVPDRQHALRELAPLDAIVLGMGEDGHTASLFPGAPQLAAGLDPGAAARLIAVDPPAAPHRRLSMTLAMLLDSRALFLPLQGPRKNAVYEQARALGDVMRHPIAAVLAQTRVPVQVYRAPA